MEISKLYEKPFFFEETFSLSFKVTVPCNVPTINV